MARNNRSISNTHESLAEAVSISRQFLRSVRIDVDFGREDALLGYVCQGTARGLIESMATQIVGTQQRAFTWTGPYGGGKSSLALMLCSLVGPNPKLRAQAKSILKLPKDSPVHRAFESKDTGWVVLPVVGRRGSVSTALSQTLARTQGLAPSRRKAADVIGDLVRAAEAAPHGVLVVIDELGKFLESSAQDGDDIYFFQELAEAASRCDGKLVIIGILHQAFEAYASRLGRQARDDWAKVQGRFVDMPLIAATDEVIELVGQAIEIKSDIDLTGVAKLSEKVAGVIRERRPGTLPTLGASLKRCWPLHPVTAALLGPVSRRRFGQNERSTFGFLASREPLGFVEFLNGSDVHWLSMYGPARYWDYLRANHEPAILASPDGHKWAIAADAVERSEAKGGELHVELAKAVSLIEMFRNGSGLVASERVLAISMPNASEADLRKALHDLDEWKILIERKHLGAWGVYAGSDFDIEGAITTARGEIGQPDLARVSALADLHPILAKRLYQTTGTMRWFARRIVRLTEVEQEIQDLEADVRSAGTFVLCLPDVGQTLKSAEHKLKRLSAKVAGSVLLGTPKNAEAIAELSLELAASERVESTRPELQGDAVARRELVARTESLRSKLEEELGDAFELSRWFYQGELLGKHHGTILPAIASSIAQEMYDETPHIFSELVNREALSSNSVKARRELMYRMVSHGDVANLGYEGYPADAGLYYTILQALGLHRTKAGSGWGFYNPGTHERADTLRPLWAKTKSLMLTGGRSTTLAEIYKYWAAPPFGLRAGVMPILALAFFLAHRSSLAMYVSGAFTSDITDASVDEWMLDPKAIRFQHVEASQDQARFVSAIAQSVASQTRTEVGDQPLDAARGLVGLVVGLPGWSQRTTTVSPIAQDVRAMLLRANDPHKVLFSDLPTLLGVRDPEDLLTKLMAITAELSAAYGKMLASVRDRLFEALDHSGRDIESLQQRAANVKGITGDFRLDAFAARLETYEADNETIEGLISLAVSKTSSQWVDRDIDAALVQLATWSLDFRKTEIMAHLRGRPSTRRVIGVVFGSGQGVDVSSSVDIAEVDIPAVDRVVKELLTRFHGERPEVVLAALAEAGAHMVKNSQQRIPS